MAKPHPHEEHLKSFPPGYRFKPRDEELVIHYLKKKLYKQELPPNLIMEVQLYNHNPMTLVEACKSYGEGEWYFFTPRDKKYKNGSRPRRAAGDGYWKATGADRSLKCKGQEVGFRKALVFYKGKPPGEKTDWMMHEFRLKNPPPRSNPNQNDMRLDDWVLCKIYKKTDKSMKSSNARQAAFARTEIQELDEPIPAAPIPQQAAALMPFDYGSTQLDGVSLPTSPSSYFEDDAFLDPNSKLLLDDISDDYYDHKFTDPFPLPLSLPLPLPSSTTPFPPSNFINTNHHYSKLGTEFTSKFLNSHPYP